MRNLKKFLALVLAMMMAFSLMVTANAAKYTNPKTDYPDFDSVTEEFKEAVNVLAGMGVMTGDNGSFYPERTIMRSEMAAVMYRLMTGDVSNLKNQLYADIAAERFDDVKATDWFASYIGWCYDAGLMKGYNGKVRPWDPVSGYEAEIMVLRAMGYGKNGEYNGQYWSVNASTDATLYGLLDKVSNTSYKNTLSTNTRRDVVASIVFEGAQEPTVTWTPAGGYNQYVGVPSAQNPGQNVTNPSLGYKNFGLTPYYSAIVGNQATGEGGTLLGDAYRTTGTVGQEAVKDQYGYAIKYVMEDDGTTRKIIYRYLNNDIADGPDPDYDKTTANNTNGTAKPVQVYYEGVTGSVWTGDNYSYEGATSFDMATGLDEFAHEVTMWFDVTSRNSKGVYHAYAMIDHNEKDEAFYSQTVLGTTDVEDVTGVDEGTVMWSDRYSRIGDLAFDSQDNLSPISTYRKVTNPNGVVYIALSAEVGEIEEKNITAKKPYLTLGDDTTNVSVFTNETANPDRIHLANLTAETKDAQKETGALVTAYQIVGTSFTLADANGNANINTDTAWGKVKYQLDPMKTKTVTISTYFAPIGSDMVTIDGYDNVVTSVSPAGADAMSLSGITEGSKIISKRLPIAVNDTPDDYGANNLLASVTYDAYVDIVGRFISLTPVNDTKFIYGTYTDYVIGGQGTGTINYNIVGVDWDAKIQAENTIKTYGTPLLNNVDPMNGTEYDDITTTKKDQGNVNSGNEIQTGVNTGYMYNAATGNLDPIVRDARALVDGGVNDYADALTAAEYTTWTFTSADAARGFARVKNGGVDYLVTNDTEFIIVTGTGTATLKVETAKGITGLLAGGTSADITKNPMTDFSNKAISGDMNNVYFQTDEDLFGTVHTNDNAVVEKVILSDGNLTRWNAQTLYFNYDGVAPTGTQLPSASSTVEQYALWNNGEKNTYFIDWSVSTQSAGGSWAGNTAIEVETFYTLAKIDDVNGIPVYRAVALESNVDLDYRDAFNSKQAGDAVIYDYITVNNLSTALLKKDDSELVYSISKDVMICDVEYKSVTGTSSARNEIKTVAELNHAVSVMNTAHDTAIYDDIEVAVVCDGSVITGIYVTHVPTT